MELRLTRPDDWHLHVRDGAAMADVIGASAHVFGRAIIMPNLKPPIVTVAQALDYRARIMSALAPESRFQPLMTLYLTKHTRVEDIVALKECPDVVAVKYYPAGATTHSEAGVTDLRSVWAVLEAMQELQIPLLIHGEVTTASVDIFEREYCFVRHVLDPLLDSLPRLRVVLEHITTAEAVEYILAGEDRVAATITAHHLLMNRNALFQGGIRPHHYCLPVLKRESHRQALLGAIASGSPRFFLGTDSAPHAQNTKENACGCAGMYTAPAAMPFYAQAFEEAGALDKLEAFAAFHGADFYRLPRNRDYITLHKSPWIMPEHYPFGNEKLIPLYAGSTIPWQLGA
jgi:dihydroorotase